MDSKIITFGGQETPFKGIDRTAASNDSNPGSVRVIKDMEILPVGKLKMREEYDALYDYRPSQYEHTTNDTANEQLVAAVTDTHVTWRSHRRKMVAVTNNGGYEYTFTGYVEQAASALNNTRLYLHRGKRGTTDILFPADGIVVSPEPLTVCSVSDLAGGGYDAADWIEFSIVAAADSNSIYVVATLHDDSGAQTEVRFYEITDIYNADFGAAIVTVQTVGVDSYIQQSASITRDVDIEIGSDGADNDGYGGDRLFFFWGFDAGGGTDAVIKYTSTADLTDVDTYVSGLGADVFALSIVLDPNVQSTNSLWLCFTLNVGVADKLYVQNFTNVSGITSANKIGATGSPVLIVSNIYDGVWADFYYGACFAIDTDGTQHFLYRTADQTLTHFYYGGSAKNVTTALSNVSEEVKNTCWDFVVKGKLITVFLADGGTESKVTKYVRIIDSNDTDYNVSAFHTTELVRAASATTYNDLRYFGCYRKYEINTSKRLSYMIGTSATADMTLRYLHEDKGFFDADFDGNITDTADRQVDIEKLAEPLVADADGAMTQIKILQCNDDKLYKRGNYQWDLLEGQRNVNNTGWNWTTNFGTGCHQIWDLNGTVRFNAGSGTTNQNGWYGYINRDYFVNTTNRYTDHYSEHARLDPPDISTIIVGSSWEVSWADRIEGYSWFAKGEGEGDEMLVLTTEVTNKYKYNEDGTPLQYIDLFLAFSYEYDGWQESQLVRYAAGGIGGGANGGYVRVGIMPRQQLADIYPLIKIIFQMPIWNKVSSPLNARVTAINIYMGEKLSDSDTYETVEYKHAKHITVSDNIAAGESVFTGSTVADDIKGTKAWSAGSDYTLTTYLDYINYSGATETASFRLGNKNVLYKSTGSGTEIYTKECFIPEGYKYSIVLNDEVYVANLRLAGVTRENRIMRSARKLDSYVTPDHLTDAPGTYADLPYSIYGLSKVGDKTLLVLGGSGVDVFDVSSGMLSRVDEAINIGTTSPTSVTEIIEGGLGQILRGTIYKDIDGHIRLCDAYGAPIISDPIRDDHDTTFRGCEYFYDQSYAANFAYMPLYQKLIMAYDTTTKTAIFVFDLKRGLKDFYYWEWTDRLKALAVGVDGELFWTDGIQVMVYPQAGTRDTPDPQWRSQNITFPDDMRVLAKKVWCDYICNWSSDPELKPYVYKDGTETAATNALAVAATQTRDMTGFAYGTDSLREVGFGFKTTTPANITSLEIDKIAFELSMMRRRPQ